MIDWRTANLGSYTCRLCGGLVLTGKGCYECKACPRDAASMPHVEHPRFARERAQVPRRGVDTCPEG